LRKNRQYERSDKNGDIRSEENGLEIAFRKAWFSICNFAKLDNRSDIRGKALRKVHIAPSDQKRKQGE
jgi:hypothetical protein